MMMGGYLVGGNSYNLPNKFQTFQSTNNNTVTNTNTDITANTGFDNFHLNDPMAFLKGVNSRLSNALAPLSINRNELNPNISQASLDKLNIRLVDPAPQQSIYSNGQYAGMPYLGLQNSYGNTTGSMMPMVVQGPNGPQIVGYVMVQPQQQQTTAMPYGYAPPYTGTYRTGGNNNGYQTQVPQSVWQQTSPPPMASQTVWQAPVNNNNTPPPLVIVTEANLPNNFQGVKALLEKVKNEPNGSLTQTQRNSISTIVQYERDINNLKLQTAENALQAVMEKLNTNTEKLQANKEKLLQLVEKQSAAEARVTDAEVKLKTNAENLKSFNAQLISNTQEREENTVLLQLQLRQDLETKKAEIEAKIKDAEIDKVKLESDKTTAEQDANKLAQEKTSLEQEKTTLTQEKTTLTNEKNKVEDEKAACVAKDKELTNTQSKTEQTPTK